MKQKVQFDLLDSVQPKKTRFDLSKDLKNDSVVLRTYGHEDQYNRSSKGHRRLATDGSDDFLQPGFGGYSYHDGVTVAKMESSKYRDGSQSRIRDSSQTAQSKHSQMDRRGQDPVVEWNSKQNDVRAQRLKLDQDMVDKNSVIRKSLQSDSYYKRHRQKARKDVRGPSTELSHSSVRQAKQKKGLNLFSHIPLSFMNSLTPKGRGQPKDDSVNHASKKTSETYKNRQISSGKLTQPSKDSHYEFQDNEESLNGKYRGLAQVKSDMSSSNNERIKTKVNLSQEYKAERDYRSKLAQQSTQAPNRKSLLQTAQDHYAKRSSSRKGQQLSPSLIHPSKTSQSYSKDVYGVQSSKTYTYKDKEKELLREQQNSLSKLKMQQTIKSNRLDSFEIKPLHPSNNPSSQNTRESYKRDSSNLHQQANVNSSQNFKKQLSIDIFGTTAATIPKGPQTTKHADLKKRNEMADFDNQGMIFNTMNDGVSEMDMKYLQNRNISSTQYTNKDYQERGRSSRTGGSSVNAMKNNPLGVLLPSNIAANKIVPQSSHQRIKSSNYANRDYDHQEDKHQSKQNQFFKKEKVDYDLKVNYKEAHYNPKTYTQEGKYDHRNERNHSESKENYYQALENMLSKAQHQGNLTEKQIEYARRYAEHKLSQTSKQSREEQVLRGSRETRDRISGDKQVSFKQASYRK